MSQPAKKQPLLQNLVTGSALVSARQPNHTLVCLFLRGGADTLNMFIPYGDDEYYRQRPTIGIARPSKGGKDSALDLDGYYGLNPRMANLKQAFDEGRLAVVQGVGMDNPSGSHFECQDQMEHGEAFGETVGGGWLGRHLRSRTGNRASSLSAVAIGSAMPESLRGAPAASVLESLEDLELKTRAGEPEEVARILARMYGGDASVLGKQGRETVDLLKRVRKIREKKYVPENGVDYPDDKMAQGLREIARLVKAEVGLEVACLDYGGWDTHFFQGALASFHGNKAEALANALDAFDRDLKSHRNRVTTVVMTEFGRRLYENASLGTDHGRGFAMMVMGGRAKGGSIHGPRPVMKNETADGPGGLRISHDYRSVLGEIVEGVTGNTKLDAVFPGAVKNKIGLVS